MKARHCVGQTPVRGHEHVAERLYLWNDTCCFNWWQVFECIQNALWIFSANKTTTLIYAWKDGI